MFRTLNDLFIKMEKIKVVKEIEIKVSYLEIYNENIKDLLTSDDKNLDLREDPIKGVCVHNISEMDVTSTNEIM